MIPALIAASVLTHHRGGGGGGGGGDAWDPANYTVANPSFPPTFTNSNRTVTANGTSGGQIIVASTRSHTTGKYYFEFLIVVMGGSNLPSLGVAPQITITTYPGYIIGGFSPDTIGASITMGSPPSQGTRVQGNNGSACEFHNFFAPADTGDRINVQLDIDAQTILYGVNGTMFSAPGSVTGDGPLITHIGAPTGPLFIAMATSGGGSVTLCTASSSWASPGLATGYSEW